MNELDLASQEALRMKEGLADYKKAFSRRVAAFAAVFVVGVLTGSVFFGFFEDRAVRQHGFLSETLFDWQRVVIETHSVLQTVEDARDLPGLRDLFDATHAKLSKINVSKQTVTIFVVRSSPITHMSFVTSDQRSLEVYLTPTFKADLSEPVFTNRFGVSTATWTRNNREYLILGTADMSLVWEAAKILSAS